MRRVDYAGLMLLFRWKKLPGSYACLISASLTRLRPKALSTPAFSASPARPVKFR